MIRENDYHSLSIHRTSYISFAGNLDRLSETDHLPTVRDILLRLDGAMQSRWSECWTGKRSKHTRHIKDVLKSMEKEPRG